MPAAPGSCLAPLDACPGVRRWSWHAASAPAAAGAGAGRRHPGTSAAAATAATTTGHPPGAGVTGAAAAAAAAGPLAVCGRRCMPGLPPCCTGLCCRGLGRAAHLVRTLSAGSAQAAAGCAAANASCGPALRLQPGADAGQARRRSAQVVRLPRGRDRPAQVCVLAGPEGPLPQGGRGHLHPGARPRLCCWVLRDSACAPLPPQGCPGPCRGTRKLPRPFPSSRR